MAQAIGVNDGTVGTNGGNGSCKKLLTKHAFQNPQFVVQTILNRQMGIPDFSSNGDVSRTIIARQLFRTRSASEEKGKSVKAAKMVLRPGINVQHLDGGVKVTSWTQIELSEKLEVRITDTKLWVRRKIGTLRGIAMSEEFYSVGPSHRSGLNCVKRFHSSDTGKIKKVDVIGTRQLTSEKSITHLLTLMEPGILRAFDLGKNQITDEIKFPKTISQGGQIKFTEMDAFEHSRKIFIMGMDKSLTKVIIIMKYPPWKESKIIQVKIPVKIYTNEGVCFFKQNKVLQITTWPLLMKKVTKTSVSLFPTANSLPNIQFEGELTELPTILSTISLQTNHFGIMDMSVPMFYGAVKSGLNFFKINNIEHSVYKFTSKQPLYADETIEVFPFPDGSFKALICTPFSGESQIVEFETEWSNNENQRFVKARNLDVFKYWEKSRTSQASIAAATTTEGRRPKRACVNNKASELCASKISTLGITHCPLMDLIAVLTADDDEFQVAIYEPLTFNVVKALPPVLAWPRIKGSDDVNKNRETITSTEFVFEPEFIFVSFKYSGQPQPEVFFARLLAGKDAPN